MIKTAGLSSLGSDIVELERVLAAFKSAIVGLQFLTKRLTNACRRKLWKDS